MRHDSHLEKEDRLSIGDICLHRCLSIFCARGDRCPDLGNADSRDCTPVSQPIYFNESTWPFMLGLFYTRLSCISNWKQSAGEDG